MTELKTINDFKQQDWSTNESCKGVVGAVFYDLKQEAIKWIKEIKEAYKQDGAQIKLETTGGLSPIFTDAVSFIKHFFNITEDDLK